MLYNTTLFFKYFLSKQSLMGKGVFFFVCSCAKFVIKHAMIVLLFSSLSVSNCRLLLFAVAKIAGVIALHNIKYSPHMANVFALFVCCNNLLTGATKSLLFSAYNISRSDR